MPLIDGFMGIFGSLSSVKMILDPLSLIFEGIFEVLGPLIDELLAPIIGILKIFGKILGQMLVPVLNMLTPVFEGLAKVMLWFANKVMIPVANFIIGIWNGIAKALNKALGWAGVKIKYADKIDEYSMDDAAAEGADTTASNASTSGTTGAGAQYTGSQAITFNFYNQGNVVGTGGLEELALIIDNLISRNARYA